MALQGKIFQVFVVQLGQFSKLLPPGSFHQDIPTLSPITCSTDVIQGLLSSLAICRRHLCMFLLASGDTSEWLEISGQSHPGVDYFATHTNRITAKECRKNMVLCLIYVHIHQTLSS